MTPTEAILRKTLVASGIDSAGWSHVQAGLRDRAFFMAEVERARILHAARTGVADILRSGKSMSEVRRDLREMLRQDGYQPSEEYRGTIKDLFSKQRLDVMLKTNVDQARGYARHLRATSRGALAAFPAYEFVRVQQRLKPRSDWPQRWQKACRQVNFEGVARGTSRMIALKTSPVWTALSVFGNPFPPFDFGSGMGLDDVEASVCRELGLVEKQTPPEIHLNDSLQAEVPIADNSPEAARLKSAFGDQVRFDGDVARWQGNLIQDVLVGKHSKARLGTASSRMLAKLEKVAPPEDVSALRAMNPTFNRNTFLSHAVKHLGGNEKRLKDNIPCSSGDYELMPETWRNPDSIMKIKPHHYVLELETLDGGFLQLAVNTMRGFSSFYKTKKPLGAAPENALGIPLGP